MAEVVELKPNDRAPVFTLKDSHEKSVSLVDFKGTWVVLYFYPQDDTPGCTVEAIAFTKYVKEFEAAQAAVIGVSPDSCASHVAFTGKYGLAVTLLSDPDHHALGPYGVWRLKNAYGKTYWGVHRSTFLLRPDGVVAHAWYGVKAEGHAEEVLKTLKSLKGV